MESEKRTETYYTILKQYWGYTEFRPMQLEVIELVCSGWDTLALMPTGAGKSLLYQIPAMVKEGVCVVVTPLIALMKDQVDALRARGISAAAIHSGLTMMQIDLILDNASWGDLKFLYVAPERLASGAFRERLVNIPVSILAVDEAHCISQWGYDFRPSYLRIAQIRELLPDTPIIALTASATPLVVKDILHNLRMKEGVIRRSSFARSNLSFVVREGDDKKQHLLRVVNSVVGSGIVYARTRQMVENIASDFVEQGISAEGYHAGMPYGERIKKQERWMDGSTRIMVATNAFGMGVDKPDVRFVLHYDQPDSLEAYYQEAGRAGRDGQRSYAVLITANDDQRRFKKRFELEFPPIEQIRACYQALFNYLQIGIGDGKWASFNFNIYHFSAQAHIYTGSVLSVIKVLQQNDYLTLTDEADNPARILFIVGRDDLYKVRIETEELDLIIRTLLRLYTGLFNERLIAIDTQEIAEAMKCDVVRVNELLKQLWQMRIIKYIPGSRSPILMLHEERLPINDLYISPESYALRKQMTVERMEAMMEYSGGNQRCRSVVMQSYFGEEQASDCGACDVCLTRKRESAGIDSQKEKQLMESIIALLKKTPYRTKELIANFKCSPEKVIEAIDQLLELGIIENSKDGKIVLK